MRDPRLDPQKDDVLFSPKHQSYRKVIYLLDGGNIIAYHLSMRDGSERIERTTLKGWRRWSKGRGRPEVVHPKIKRDPKENPEVGDIILNQQTLLERKVVAVQTDESGRTVVWFQSVNAKGITRLEKTSLASWRAYTFRYPIKIIGENR